MVTPIALSLLPASLLHMPSEPCAFLSTPIALSLVPCLVLSHVIRNPLAIRNPQTHTHAQVFTHMHTHTTYIYIHTHYIHTYVHTYIYTHSHIYTHKWIQTRWTGPLDNMGCQTPGQRPRGVLHPRYQPLFLALSCLQQLLLVSKFIWILMGGGPPGPSLHPSGPDKGLANGGPNK